MFCLNKTLSSQQFGETANFPTPQFDGLSIIYKMGGKLKDESADSIETWEKILLKEKDLPS